MNGKLQPARAVIVAIALMLIAVSLTACTGGPATVTVTTPTTIIAPTGQTSTPGKVTPLPMPTSQSPATATVTTPPPPTGQSDVRITTIFYDGLVPRTESDEYVEITNFGPNAQDLTGWRLIDISEGYPSFVFPSFVLQSGQTIRVYTNEIHPEWGGFSFGFGKAIWNNRTPDTAALYDNRGLEVSRRSY